MLYDYRFQLKYLEIYIFHYLYIDENSNIAFAKEYSKSYLRYLFQINEILGIRIATLINIAYYFDLMNQIKFEINNHTFVKWSEDYLKKYENSE